MSRLTCCCRSPYVGAIPHLGPYFSSGPWRPNWGSEAGKPALSSPAPTLFWRQRMPDFAAKSRRRLLFYLPPSSPLPPSQPPPNSDASTRGERARAEADSMSGHRIPAGARLGGITSRRHAELLLHSGVGDVSVKDLRLRRVVPPASGSLDSSPVCSATVKPGSVVSTPPEAASSAAAAEDLDRKPVSQRLFLHLSRVRAYSHCISVVSASDYCPGSPSGSGAPTVQARARPRLVRLPAAAAIPQRDGQER